MRKLVTGISIALVVLMLEMSGFAQGCAMCRAALEQSAEGRFVASSFAHGIIMMLILPYALFGIFGVIIYRAYRKKSKTSPEP
jgi:Na+/melibiose symporter-like transporter